MTTHGRIGRYRILGQIAAGGQATVYRAQDDALARQVAVKVLHPHLSGEAAFRERFLREARTAAGLNHPNIVVIYEVGEDPSPGAGRRQFIAMEHLPETLQDVLRERGALPWREALEIVRQIASGLRAAHERSVVHRDIRSDTLRPGRRQIHPPSPADRYRASSAAGPRAVTTGRFRGSLGGDS